MGIHLLLKTVTLLEINISIPVPFAPLRRAILSFPAPSSGMRFLADPGIARERTGPKRHRVFGYDAHLMILNEGTEPS
jgi:hypothetical protein